MPPDLTAFDREYRYRPSRGLLWLVVGVALVWVALFVLDFSEAASSPVRVLHALGALVYVVAVVKLLAVPSTVVLDAEGLHVRPWFRWRTLRWDEVRQVQRDASGKFPSAVLVQGPPVRLAGLPLEAGERLQAALRERRSA